MRATEHIVVAGAGLAGLRAAEALRRHGFRGALTLVGDEPHLPYNRPPLSKQVLAGQETPLTFPTDDLVVEWRLGTATIGLDPRARTIGLSDGSTLGFDGLVIATGSRARPWAHPLPATGVHTLRSLEDARALHREVRPGSRVVIVGGGFLGSEAACALRSRGAEVDLVDHGSFPLAALGREIGARVAARHEEHGVRLHRRSTVAAIEGGRRVRSVRLGDGTVLAADVVLLALGAVPNTEWLAGSGLTLERGHVLCDASCTAVGTHGIVAAGDVAAWQDPTTWELRHLEHWSHASEMAQAAAITLLNRTGMPQVYDPIPTFWTDQWDLKIRSAGWLADATNLTVTEEDADRGRLIVEAHREGHLVGAITVNRARAHIDYQRTLATQQQLRIASAM